MDGFLKRISREMGGNLRAGLSTKPKKKGTKDVIVQGSFGAAKQPTVSVYEADLHQLYKTRRH